MKYYYYTFSTAIGNGCGVYNGKAFNWPFILSTFEGDKDVQNPICTFFKEITKEESLLFKSTF